MSALQEVFARFSTKFDSSELNKGASAIDGVKGKLVGLAATLASGLAVRQLYGFAQASATIGDDIAKAARVIGIGTDDLQAWQHAAGLAGVSAGQLTTGLGRLSRNMYDAQRGLKTALEPFQDLGVSFEDANGELRPVQDVLMDLADPISSLGSNSERSAIAMTLLGRAGARMLPLFEQGSAGVATAREEFERLGGASEEFLGLSEGLVDSNQELDTALLGLRSTFATLLIPVVQRVVDVGTDLAVGFRLVLDNSKLIQAAAIVLAGALAAKLAPAFAAAAAKSALFLLANLPLVASIALATFLILGMVLVVEDLLVALGGGKSVLGDFSDSVYDWIEANQGVSVVADIWKELLDTMTAVYEFFGGDLDHEDELTNVRGLGGPDARRFHSNEEAATFRGSILGRAERLGRETRTDRDLRRTNRARVRREAGAIPTTTERGLGSERVYAEALERSPARRIRQASAAFQGLQAGGAPVVLNQTTTNNISGARLTQRELEQSMARINGRHAEEAVEALATGVAAGEGI